MVSSVSLTVIVSLKETLRLRAGDILFGASTMIVGGTKELFESSFLDGLIDIGSKED
jgi:hypothetical protein